MSEPILIQQQRQILREFRQAVTTRRQQEQEADSRYREERKQADTLLEQIKEKARKSQEEEIARAQKRHEEMVKAAEKAWTHAQKRAADAQTQLDKNLKRCMDYLLNAGLSTALIPPEIPPTPPEGMTGDEDPAQMLEQSLRAVKRESEAVVESVIELWRWKETWQRRRDRAIGIAAVAALAGLLLFSHNYVQVQEMARQATATAQAEQATATAQAKATATVQAILAARPLSKDVIVWANQEWQDSGMYIQQGEKVVITYLFDQWSPWPGYSVDAGGIIDSTNGSNVLKGFPHASLIGLIGDGEYFFIGTKATIAAEQSGTLWLRINDARIDDNSGSIAVRVEVH